MEAFYTWVAVAGVLSQLPWGPRRALQDWVHAADVRVLKPVIDAPYSFAKVPEAFAHLKHGAFGKLVVQVRNQ